MSSFTSCLTASLAHTILVEFLGTLGAVKAVEFLDTRAACLSPPHPAAKPDSSSGPPSRLGAPTCMIQGYATHLGRDASSPSRCSSYSGPPQSVSPGRGAARCVLHIAVSYNSGNVQWLPCKTGPRACQETQGERKRERCEACRNQNSSKIILVSPCSSPWKEFEVLRTKALSRARMQPSARSVPDCLSSHTH